jgi:hypothetical protein
MLACLLRQARPVHGDAIFDQPPQTIDPSDRVEEEIVARADHQHFMKLRIDPEQTRPGHGLVSALEDFRLLLARLAERIQVRLKAWKQDRLGLDRGTKLIRILVALTKFFDYLIDNSTTIWNKPPKWLKVYLLYIQNSWIENFEELEPQKYGDFIKITFVQPNQINYHAYEWKPGLLLLFTSSKQEEYEKTLSQFLKERIGISQAWIRPIILNRIIDYLTNKHKAEIYRFISKRRKEWLTPSQVRPLIDRRISYSGKDAYITLKEFQMYYGVIASTIDMRIDENKIQINRNGLFILRQVNRTTLDILKEIIQLIVDEQLRIKMISERFTIMKEKISIQNKEFEIPQIVSGLIILPLVKLSTRMIQKMFHSNDSQSNVYAEDDFEYGFSFIDQNIYDNPELLFSATVVDQNKGTVFGLSGAKSEMILVPKHYTIFESFIRFYNFVSEVFDDEAELSTFSEYVVM